MDLALSEEQQTLVDAFTAFFAREVPIGRVRAAEPGGFDDRLWRQAVAIGVPGMALDGAQLIDLALVCEQAGARLVPIPLVEAFVAVRALASHAGLREEVAGGRLATVALRPAVDSRLRLVPAGAVAEIVVALDRGRLVAQVGPSPGGGPVNLGSAPLADRRIRPDAIVLATGAEALDQHQQAVSEWKVLTAAALAGLGAAALSVGVAYVKARHQFGAAIGSFQAVQHKLADAATAVDGARLLAYRAAWAVG
ncbi:MAG TPA: acyl-CoA dehydrogenase family protein, partial [Acidimicrobiales bacterium]|nr:acyl-CoA dehydrogenase family protein [Acidimicrobiales bacterium]